MWASALTVFSRINHAESLNGKGVNLHQFLQPVAVVLDAIYRVIHRLDVPATVFTFLCTTLSVFIEENLVLDCNNAVKTLYAWIGSSLDRILVQDTAASPFTAQMMSDTVKTNSSILSTMEKISLANSRSSISVDKNISILVQNLLERYIAPIGPGLAGQQNTKDGMPSARTAVASIATTLLQILWRCVERSPVCDLEITTLLRCGFSPETEHYVHMIVQLTLRKDVDNIDDKYDLIEKSALQIRAITFNRLNEWVNISIREIGLAERAMKDWVLKHSSWKCGKFLISAFF